MTSLRIHKRILLLVAAVFAYPMVVAAQEVAIPRFEGSITYSYLREGSTPGYTGTDLPKGFGASGVLNLNSWLGAELETSHFWGQQPLVVPLSNGITEGNSTVHTLMGGPRLTYRRIGKVTPFAHLLIGGAGIYSGYGTPPPTSPTPNQPASPSQPYPTSPVGAYGFHPTTNMVFAWGVGGGLDVNVNDRLAVRLVQADYINFRTDAFSGKPVNSARISAGLVLRFGSASQ